MRKLTVTCDRCGRETEEPFRVGVVAEASNSTSTNSSLLNSRIERHCGAMLFAEVDWCRDCCEATGIKTRWVHGAKVAPAEPMTLDEMVREIAAEAAREAVS